jgi:glycosyltransferase involved in cell wall biosynthesis
MKVAIDISCIRGERAGIGTYAVNLLHGLEKVDRENKYVLYTFYSRSPGFRLDETVLPVTKNFRLEKKNLPFRLARVMLTNMGVPIEFFIGSCDVLHGLDHSAHYSKKAKLVITVHDLAFLLYPTKGFNSPEFMKQAAPHFSELIGRADRIIAVSENTKMDVLRLLGVPEQKVSVVYEAADEIFRPLNDESILESVRLRYGLKNNRFIVYVGTLEPRKNLASLLKAFNRLKKIRKIEHKLVLAGRKGWSYGQIFDLVRDLHLQNDVILPGYIPKHDLPGLYNLADTFVYPSLYEGFGLPPLEAMACGLPVIASNTSCFPEILGDAAILTDPNNEDEFSQQIYAVLSDPSLRSSMRQKGLARASQFSWERTARETIDVYRTCAC